LGALGKTSLAAKQSRRAHPVQAKSFSKNMPNRIDDSELEPPRYDPVYLHARREAVEILLAWAVSLVWSVGYCSLRGYENDAPVEMVLGIPAWVFWGIVAPWIAASVFTFYYSLVRMKSDPLGGEPAANEADSSAKNARRRREA
jgi:hypothetical protein